MSITGLDSHFSTLHETFQTLQALQNTNHFLLFYNTLHNAQKLLKEMEQIIRTQNKRFELLPSNLLIIIYTFSFPSSYESCQFVCKNWLMIFKLSMGVKLLTMHLAHSYRAGINGVKPNPQKAIHLYEQATTRGDIEADSWVVFTSFEKPYGDHTLDDEEAFRRSQLGVEKSIPLAYYNLGSCYQDGRGVKKDLSKAVEMMQRGAELGDGYALNSLGYYYDEGIGVEKDVKKAITFYQQAISIQNPHAQVNLGVLYEKGIGIEKSCFEAFRLYQLSAEQGDEDAQYYTAICYEEGIGIAKNVEEAIRWYKKSAERGHEGAKSKCLEYNKDGEQEKDKENSKDDEENEDDEEEDDDE